MMEVRRGGAPIFPFFRAIGSMGPLEQAPLLPWSFAFLAIEDLRTFFRLGPLTRARHQELWYHATQALCRPYPFVPLRHIRANWETTYVWFCRNMATFAAEAYRVLGAGLERARLPPAPRPWPPRPPRSTHRSASRNDERC